MTSDFDAFKEQDRGYHNDPHGVATYDRRITRKYRLEHKYFTVEPWIQKMIDKKVDLVLDCGCGTGAVTMRLLGHGIKTVS